VNEGAVHGAWLGVASRLARMHPFVHASTAAVAEPFCKRVQTCAERTGDLYLSNVPPSSCVY
jgi:hypothetical protein